VTVETVLEQPQERTERLRGRADWGFRADSHRRLALFTLAALALNSLIFAPISLWPISFVCMVPWLLVIGGSSRAPRVYFWSYVWGLAFFLFNMRWLYLATGLGYVALSIYLAVYYPLVACPVRHAVRRRGWPMAVAFPIVWTGGELLRAVVMSGFPWFFLSHSLYKVPPLIQISDTLGAYGVSFVIAAVNGTIADLWFTRAVPKNSAVFHYRRRAARWGAGWAIGLLVLSLAYGIFQLLRDTTRPGPSIAILQGDFIMTVEGEETRDAEKRKIFYAMMEEASKQSPDLYLLPETPWIMYLNPEARDGHAVSQQSFNALRRHATKHGAYVVTGSASLFRTPYDLLTKERRYNSAAVFSPDGAEPYQYHKVHTVYFGETVPFRSGRFRFLYLWINRMMPFSNNGEFEYSLFPGDEFKVFEMNPPSQPQEKYRFGIPICYEDVMPYVSRRFASDGTGGKRADFLLNISNDGWFGRGMQQPQHLAICVFRAVENRVGFARAVNTGVSAFIDPSGRIHDVVTGDPLKRWHKQCGFAVARVGVDSRNTLYSRLGDVFGWACVLLGFALYVDYWVLRARLRKDG